MNEELGKTVRIDIPADDLRRLSSGGSTMRIRRKGPVSTKRPETHEGGLASQKLLDSIYDAVIVTNTKGRIENANQRALDFLYFKHADLLNLNILNILAGSGEDLLVDLLQNLKKEKFVLIQCFCLREDNSLFPAEVAVNLLESERVETLYFFIRDISVRRKTEEQLHLEHTAVHNAASAIVITDLKGVLEYANPATRRMWAVPEDAQIEGRDLRKLWTDLEQAEQMIGEVLGPNGAWVGELEALRFDQQAIPVEISAVLIHNSDADPAGMVFSLTDLSERRSAEAAMRDAERQKATLASIGATCHHIGQPATVLQANMELLDRMLPDVDEYVRSLISSGISAAAQVSKILHQLNTMSGFRAEKYLERIGAADNPANQILKLDQGA